MSRARLYSPLPFAVPSDCSSLCFVAFFFFNSNFDSKILFCFLCIYLVFRRPCVRETTVILGGRCVLSSSSVSPVPSSHRALLCTACSSCLAGSSWPTRKEHRLLERHVFDFKFPTATAHPARRRSNSRRRRDSPRLASSRAMLNYASLALRPLPDFYLSSFSKAALAFLWNVLGARSSRSKRTTKKQTQRNEKQTESCSLRMLNKQHNKTKLSRRVLNICYSRISILNYAAGLECFYIS